jgi:hypothetical protein
VIRPGCKAHTVGNQIICDDCGLTWDMDDREPPDCNQGAPIRRTCGNCANGQGLSCLALQWFVGDFVSPESLATLKQFDMSRCPCWCVQE